MTKAFNPSPQPREDGGTDYKVQHCPNPCYWTDAEGTFVSKCPQLEITVYGMECLDDDDC